MPADDSGIAPEPALPESVTEHDNLVTARTTSRPESGNGSGLSRTAFTNVKIVVLAPMPMASDRMATALNPGLRRSARTA